MAVQPEEVEICRRPDGSFWQLGTGAFGTCYKGLFHGQQLVAVKVRCGAGGPRGFLALWERVCVCGGGGAPTAFA